LEIQVRLVGLPNPTALICFGFELIQNGQYTGIEAQGFRMQMLPEQMKACGTQNLYGIPPFDSELPRLMLLH
jgi:hypothetical protein